ncbi:hypothetical protein ZWY2020_032867 [Hordeum vulgare]|nr:hypothetical protein ZWY2020_032867 [Hordeum vulgare]
MDVAMEDARATLGSEWDRGSGGAEAVLGHASVGASLLVCYHEAFGPHADIILLEANDDLLPDLLQGRYNGGKFILISIYYETAALKSPFSS